MYISRLPLNAVRRDAVQLISSPYRMHAAVERAFPPGPPGDVKGDEGRILWRIDARDGGRSVWLYVVSPRRPDFTHICEQAGWPTLRGWETKDYAPVIDHLREGQLWQFRLKANPVRRVACDRGRRENPGVVGTLQGHVTERQQIDWLLARCAARGFGVLTDEGGQPMLRVARRSKETFSHGAGKGKVTLSTCVFDGVLEVEDAMEFRQTLCWGMGRAKGFGCGLLTVAPPRGGRP